ncbi:integral membrane pth11 [Trichoderma arundinaceum]|uniref:Integral membrane pth11 n=1 Tax=Trichoderma arundinaceum TaxID=490622 RepID=A0A395NBI8_TRIAR|nr:integral membrane pth11 [Trichoderma arundinaceum]
MDLNGPAIPPPPGEVSILDNPPNSNSLALGVQVFTCVFSTLCFLLRIYGRCFIMRKFQAEEAMAILAYYPGYLVHAWNVRLIDVVPTTYWVFVYGVFYSIVLPLLKVAIIIEWIRLFVPTTKSKSPFFWGALAIMAVQTVSGIAIVIALNLQCTPHERIWDFRVPDGKCFDLYILQVTSASIQLGSDIAMFCLPQYTIWTLKMTWQKRLGVAAIFSMGVLAIVAASFRVDVTVKHGSSPDSIYTLGPIVFWASAEQTCGFFILCVPVIPKIIQEAGILPAIKKGTGMMGSSSKSNQASNSYARGGGNTKTSVSANKDYYKLEEEGLHMKNLSESTERLHADAGATITRTTRVTVTNDSRSFSDNGSKNDTWGN